MSVGDLIEVIDGNGHRFRCEIVDPHARHTLVRIIDRTDVPRPWRGTLTIAVAPTKHLDRIEWMVEKMTEIGIDRIVPLLCRHSERKELKTERIKKIAVSAMKQSLKGSMPVIDAMTPLHDFVNEPSDAQRFVAYCSKDIERSLLAKEIRPFSDITVLIGPEGDFSPEEISDTLGAGFIPVSLGDCRLRTETAAIAALQTIHTINQLNA